MIHRIVKEGNIFFIEEQKSYWFFGTVKYWEKLKELDAPCWDDTSESYSPIRFLSIEEAESHLKPTKKEVVKVINDSDCNHTWKSVYYGSEWVVECCKCEENIFDVLSNKDAVAICQNIKE